MASHISLEKLQETLINAGLHYTIGTSSPTHHHIHHHQKKGYGVYYCPMHCEGKKNTINMVIVLCGMDLIEQVNITQATQYTCPMHPDVIKDNPGACPICGMDLISLDSSENNEQKVYNELPKKIKISVIFTLPIFIIAMGDLIPTNPLANIMSQESWNWVQFILTLPVVFYTCWICLL